MEKEEEEEWWLRGLTGRRRRKGEKENKVVVDEKKDLQRLVKVAKVYYTLVIYFSYTVNFHIV